MQVRLVSGARGCKTVVSEIQGGGGEVPPMYLWHPKITEATELMTPTIWCDSISRDILPTYQVSSKSGGTSQRSCVYVLCGK